MKFPLKGFIFAVLLMLIPNIAMAVQLAGTVVGVTGLDVTVKVDGQKMPVVGDRMEICFTLPDGEPLSIGTWQINRINGNLAVASVKEKTGNPVIGQTARISCTNPVPLKKTKLIKSKKTPSATNTITGTSVEAQRIIDQMRSPDPATKRSATRKAHKAYPNDPQIMAVAAEELNKGYTVNLRDKYHVDAMAWFCNLLGVSGDPQYAPLLKKVYRECRSKKIKKYAKKNYNKLK